MKKYKLIYNRNFCIGAASCESVFPECFRISNDGKANLIGGKKVSPGIFELEIDDAKKEKAEQAVEGCPVASIKLKEVLKRRK